MIDPRDPFQFDVEYGDPEYRSRRAAAPAPLTGAEWDGKPAAAVPVAADLPMIFPQAGGDIDVTIIPPFEYISVSGGFGYRNGEPANDQEAREPPPRRAASNAEFVEEDADPRFRVNEAATTTGNGHDPDPPDPPGKLVPDREELLQFVNLMFRNADARGCVSLRAFLDNDKRDNKPILIEAIRLNDPDFTAIMVERARQAACWDDPAVFCPPVATFQNHQNAKVDNLFEGVDLSCECDQSPQAARTTLETLLGPATVVVMSGGEWINDVTGEIEPKLHLHWRLKKPTSTKAEQELLKEARTLAANLVGGDGTNNSPVHPIRWPGSWHRKKTPRLARIVAASDNELDLNEALETLREATGARDFNAGPSSLGTKFDFNAFGSPPTGKLRAPDDAAAASALSIIPNDNLEWNDWNRVGMATWAATGGSEEGRKAFAEWSAKASKNDPTATEARWLHYRTSPPDKIGFGSLVYLARQYSPEWTYGDASGSTANKASGTTGPAGPARAAGAAYPLDPVDLWAKFDPPLLPLDLLPDVIAGFAADRSSIMGCDISSLAVGALAVCAAAIPQGIKLQPKKKDTEWLEAARLWVMEVGDPSTMKTPSILATTKPLKRIDNELANDYQEAFEKWARLPKEDQKKTPKPKKLRAMIFNTTIESVQEILKDSPNGVLLEDDELSGWFDSMYKYTGARGAQTDRAFWMKAYNGGSHTVDRITRGQTYISHLSVSILGGVQPGPISKLAKVGDDDGLMQRFIPIMAGVAGAGRDEAPGDAVGDYADLIEDLRQLEPPPNTGYVHPPTVPLTFDINALKIREQLELQHLELMKTENLNRKLASHFGKYNGIFARLCVIFHCIEHCTRRDKYGAKIKGELSSIVTGDIARRVADFLHGFLKPHAIAFYVNVLGLANDHDRMVNVADYILAHGLTRVTNRDVQRGDQTMRDLERRETDAIFEQLEALGWVDIVPSPRRGYPPHWVVNPAVHQKFAGRATEAKERRARGREMAKEISAAIKSSKATPEKE